MAIQPPWINVGSIRAELSCIHIPIAQIFRRLTVPCFLLADIGYKDPKLNTFHAVFFSITFFVKKMIAVIRK